AIDRLHTTAASHSRVMVVELMGRSTGWIAIMAGIAGGAHAIMIPEFPATLEDVCDQIQSHREQGHNYALVVVSEGVKLLHRSGETKEVTASQEKDAFGHARLGGVGNQLSSAIEERTGLETRAAVLGHIQRGGTPTAHDRILATRYGVKTAEMILSGEWGRMAALKGDQVEAIPLEAAVDELKKVPEDLYQMAQIFCG
ncbi:MAG: 6-phosphofructokinase, partial [Terriglobia bacterium]